MTLNELKIGEKATIGELHTKGRIRRRLQELGFLPGSDVFCVMRSPLNDPAAYKICGAIIAIRDKDAQTIIIERSVDDGAY